MKAENMMLTARPDKRRVVTGTLGPVLARLKTMKTAMSENRKAMTDRVFTPKTVNPMLRTMANAAPKAAPEETPMT